VLATRHNWWYPATIDRSAAEWIIAMPPGRPQVTTRRAPVPFWDGLKPEE
jgi:hypothetical protein